MGSRSSICNGNLNLDARFDGDRGNLFNNIWGTVEVDDSLVHTEFKSIPGVGTFSTRGLPSSDMKNLSRHPNRTLHSKMLILSTTNQIGTNLLEIFDMLGGRGDPNLMDLFLRFLQTRLGGFHCSVRHFVCSEYTH
uniref:Uncharacterized protein n=1 Tax=Medicago truncatula TaxID=3880 RepID=I3SEU8_MEDTR|nr:unknown [Medicago truncatula]